jgi:type IV secretory pathway VirB2 component (pilin)
MSNISPKVTAATIAAALVTIIVWVASAAGVTVPLEVQGAVTTILVAIAGYLVTDPRRS